MSNVQEALKAAIEAFELHAKQYPHMVKGYCVDALNECKTALAEIEKCEQYIEIRTGLFAHIKWLRVNDLPDGAKLYTSPQARDWVGLTYKDKVDLRENNDWYNFPNDLIEATEAKCKQLNTKG